MFFPGSQSAILRAFSVTAALVSLSACANRAPTRLAPGLGKDAIASARPGGGALSGGDRAIAQKFSPASGASASCASLLDLRRPLTLSISIERALCTHPKIREARANLSAERSQRFVAMGALLPSISGAVTRGYNENLTASFFGPSVSETKGTARSLTVNWLLYDFGGRSAQIESATETVIAAIAGQDIVLQTTFATVAETYFAVVTNTALVEVAQSGISNAQRVVAAARLRENLGASTPADRQNAQVGLAQAELFASRVNEQLQLSRGDLAAALYLDPDTPITLASASADRDLASGFYANRTSQNINKLIRDVEAHPQIRAATARANSSNAQITAAASEHLPKLTMVGNYFVNGRPGTSVSSTPSTEKFVGLSVAVPMFDGFTTYNRARAA